MNLTPEQYALTSRIDQIKQQVAGLNVAFANEIYEIITTGDPQTNLDAMGTRAVEHLQYYGALYALLAALGQGDKAVAPDPEIFIANEDGTVTYIQPQTEEEI